MTLLTFAALLALTVSAVWLLVNAAYNADPDTGGGDTVERIRHASRCRPGYTPPCPGVARASRPARDQVRAFYAALPDHVPHAVDLRPSFLPLDAALLFVADHPGWRLRYVQGAWRVISGPRAVT